MSEFDGTLDLIGSDPEAIGFPAIPSGEYEAHIARAEITETTNPDGKLPVGTKGLKLGIQINEDEEDRNGQKVANAYVWTNLWFPPADYDANAVQRMKNNLANFLVAIGEDYTKKGYKLPDADTLLGKDVTVTVRKKFNKTTNKDDNQIEGFKVAGSSTGAASESGLLV